MVGCGLHDVLDLAIEIVDAGVVRMGWVVWSEDWNAVLWLGCTLLGYTCVDIVLLMLCIET